MEFIFSTENNPKVLNVSKVGTKFPNSVYCGRPSKFGNPFVTGKDGTRTEVIEKFRIYLQNNKELKQAARDELRGKNLLCWCSPKSCHCDILLIVANNN